MQPRPIADTLMPEEPSERAGRLFSFVICLAHAFEWNLFIPKIVLFAIVRLALALTTISRHFARMCELDHQSVVTRLSRYAARLQLLGPIVIDRIWKPARTPTFDV